MMSKHSTQYEAKKAALEKMEQELRDAIEDESADMETHLVRIMKGAAIVSASFLVAYAVYRWVQRGRQDPADDKASDEPGFMDKVVDRVTDVVAGIAAQNISKYIDKLKSDLEKEIKR